MDMVTDSGSGGGGFNPEDEATRRALLHMSKVRMRVIHDSMSNSELL